MSTRLDDIKMLSEFINSCKSRLCKLLEDIDWNEEDTLKQFNTNKFLKEFENDHSVEDNNDPLLPESIDDWKHSVTLDKEKLYEILKKNKDVPTKFSDSQVNFSRAEKLALYEYVVQQTGKITEKEMSVLITEDQQNLKKEMTFAEIVAMKRNLKRRRIKHRTTKAPPLSHTEEMRSLIELQMQALKQYLNPEKKDEENVERIDKPGTSFERYEETERIEIEKHHKSRSRSRSKDKRSKERHHHHHHKKHKSSTRTECHKSKHKKKEKKRSRSVHR